MASVTPDLSPAGVCSPTRRITPSFRPWSIFVPDVPADSRREFSRAASGRQRSSFVETSLLSLSVPSSANVPLDSPSRELKTVGGRADTADRRDVDKIIQYRQERRGRKATDTASVVVRDPLNLARNRRKSVGENERRRRDRFSSSSVAALGQSGTHHVTGSVTAWCLAFESGCDLTRPML